VRTRNGWHRLDDKHGSNRGHKGKQCNARDRVLRNSCQKPGVF
jgi:hypothetical protein